MNSTALGAKKETISFISEAHEKFYYEKLKEVRYVDVYHKALCYCLGISDDTRRNINRIYDFKTGCVKPECLHDGWQTSGSEKVVRMAFNLYCNGTPKLSNVEHQLETAKAEEDKPFPQEAELYEKLERLAELNALLNMDEKGDDAIGMDAEATEPEKSQEDVKPMDKKGDEVADMSAKQSNLGKSVTDSKLSDRPAERTSLQERLAAMKARVSGNYRNCKGIGKYHRNRQRKVFF